jgi:hypothetical protein
MAFAAMFPGFDGLITLSRREGVDIRPTLLRVLTDLYVQTTAHTTDEEKQFIALTSRLIDEVDDATRAAIRARLSIYPRTPREIAEKLELASVDPSTIPVAPRLATSSATASRTTEQHETPVSSQQQTTTTLSMQPNDAQELNRMFFAAGGPERVQILRSLETAPLKPAPRIDSQRAARGAAALEHAALEADVIGFIDELGRALILPQRLTQQIVDDAGGEPLACAARALGLSSETYERIILFLDPELGASVQRVYRLSRLYDALSERVALIVLAAWRGASLANTRAKHQAGLYDDERQRARAASTPARTQTAAPSPALPLTGRTGAKG